MRRFLFNVAWCFLSAVSITASGIDDGRARADVLVLHSGGQLHGQWLNHNDQPLLFYTIRTELGGRLTLAASMVKQAIRHSPAEMEYERLAPSFGNTAAQQWKLAEWCRQQQLSEQRAIHLAQTIQLDENHVQARRALGFVHVRGQWVILDDLKRQQGYELYRGRWRLAQEIELLETRARAEQAERQWQSRIRRWRRDLESANWAQARHNIASIRNPSAVKALAEFLSKDGHRGAKMLYIESLGNIADPLALQALIQASLNDPDVEIFHACLDQIVNIQSAVAIERYIAALKNENNVRVNRAAIALARLRDTSAIVPLIDALVTTHRISSAAPGSSPDAVSMVFSNSSAIGGATTFTTGDATQVIDLPVANHDVLNALVQLGDGSSFGFDKRAWRNWYVLHKAKSANFVRSAN